MCERRLATDSIMLLRKLGLGVTAAEDSQAQAALLGAYASYGATPADARWSVCARSREGELVVSLWDGSAAPSGSHTLVYRGTVDSWDGPGNAEFREALQEAFASDRTVRLVLIRADGIDMYAAPDARHSGATFRAEPDWKGTVVSFDGSRYVIAFERGS